MGNIFYTVFNILHEVFLSITIHNSECLLRDEYRHVGVRRESLSARRIHSLNLPRENKTDSHLDIK